MVASMHLSNKQGNIVVYIAWATSLQYVIANYKL